MSTEEKRVLLKELIERLNKRRPAVAFLEVMEWRGLAAYDYDKSSFSFSDEINDAVVIQAAGDMARILFPKAMSAIAGCDWEGGEINESTIAIFGQCYATDSYFSLVFPSTVDIDIQVDDVIRFEFAVYEEDDDLITNITVLQGRGASKSDVFTDFLPVLRKKDAITTSGRAFKSLNESNIELISDIKLNRNELRDYRYPVDMQAKIAQRAYLMYGMERLRPISEIMDEIEREEREGVEGSGSLS